jgi:hypothetical protein
MLALLRCQALIDTLEGEDNPLAGVALDVHWEVRIRASKGCASLFVRTPTARACPQALRACEQQWQLIRRYLFFVYVVNY